MPEELRCKAIDLTVQWLAEWGYAWDKETILQVFEWCRQKELVVLGADVHDQFPDPDERIYYPGFWVDYANMQKDWNRMVEHSYQEAVDFIQNTPYLAQPGLIIEPTITTELDFHIFHSDEVDFKARELYKAKRNEAEEQVVIRLKEITKQLLHLREVTSRCLDGQMSFEQLIDVIRTMNYIAEADQSLVYAERLRRDLLEYALGTLLGLTSDSSEEQRMATLEQILRYLNGEEPFLGEKIWL